MQLMLHEQVAAESGTDFIDHTKYALLRWEALGQATTKTYYLADQIHTTPEGAASMLSFAHELFVSGADEQYSQCFLFARSMHGIDVSEPKKFSLI